MAQRYRLTFEFCDTADQALAICNKANENRYLRKNHPAKITPWTSKDGSERKFIAWYYTK